jgi:hypothetical protein
MNRRNVQFTLSALASLMTTAGLAQQPVTPPAPIQVNSPIIMINNSAGDQTDPHVSKDLTAYTDLKSIHYYSFSNGVDTGIPTGTSLADSLSDVSGNRVCLTRETPTFDFEVAIFDLATATTTLIDPHPGDARMGCAIAGDTLIYIDFGTGNGSGDIFSYDLAANPPAPPQPVSIDPNQEQNPNISPDGKIVVWENCPTPSNCDVFKGVRSGGVWSVSAVANSAFYEENPDTDGTWITYDSNQTSATSPDIYFVPAAGGPTTVLTLSGPQVNPSISQGFLGFESTVPPATTPDIYVYDIAQNLLYQVTSTPGVSEQLNDISVLDNGDVRMVWAADDGPNHELNVYGTTFTPIRQGSYYDCPLYDPNVAKKAGSAYPIKIQLCDVSGNNLSSPSITVHAVGVTRISTNTPIVLDDTGNANPDFDFRYDSSLQGYIFNLSTKGYATGTYNVNFFAGSDPSLHSAQFAVK